MAAPSSAHLGQIPQSLLLLAPPPRPEILKHEMKVFFVKYNDPIYVKLEKLDIMIRLASQANIAQVGLRAGTRGLGHPDNSSPCSGTSGAVAALLNSRSIQLGFGALH